MEVTPWSGESLNAANPDAGVRTLPFGPVGRVFAEEQDVGDILSGQAFRGCYPLYQIGERPGEIDHKIFEPLGTPKRGYSGDYLANSDLADLRVVIV